MTDTLTTTTVVDLEGPEALAFLAALRSVNVARGTETFRPNICSVLVDSTPDDGTRLVATDSYRLAWAEVTAPTPTGQTMLPSEIVTSLVKAITPAKAAKWGARPLTVQVTHDGSWMTSTVTTADGTVSARTPVLQGYPTWRTLLVPEGTAELAAFNPRYLAGLGEIAKAAPFAPTTPAVTVSMSGPAKPAEWTLSEDGLTVHYLLMPVKV
jgi:hypothetical protein